MKQLISRFLGWLGIYEGCGCDACHYEVYDFKLFYWFRDWDVEKPIWKFHVRKP